MENLSWLEDHIQSRLSAEEQIAILKKQLTFRTQEIDLLYQIEQEVAASLHAQDLLERLTKRAVQMLCGEAGIIGLLQEGGSLDITFFHQPCVSLIAKELPTVEIKHTKLYPGKGLASWVVNHNQPLRINHASTDPRVSGQGSQFLGVPVNQVILVPLHHPRFDGDDSILPEQILGVIGVINKRANFSAKESAGFDEMDEELLSLIGGHAARAIILAETRLKNTQENHLASLGRMVASLLHDMKTPLTVISGASQLMVESEQPEERILFSKQIQRQIHLVKSMVREVLLFAKGDSSLLIRRVLLSSFLQELQEPLQKELQSVSLSIKARYQGPAFFDEHKLTRLIYNLARNASQAMPQGGSFEIEVDLLPSSIDRSKRELQLIFSDNGPGIPESIQTHLFELFSSKKPGGTGLGLPIVKKIVSDHQGSIRINTQPGKGTSFFITLPQPLS